MKKLTLFIILLTSTIWSFAQCSATINGTNPVCNGGKNGTAIVHPSGQSPYTYAWSNGKTTASVTGLYANVNYECTITDANSCQATVNITLTQPDPIMITITSGNGQASATFTGGTPPEATYLWSNAQTTNPANGFIQGNPYTLRMTDSKGCPGTKFFYEN